MYFAGYEEHFVGDVSDAAGDGGECDTGEDVCVVALTRVQRVPVDHHRLERTPRREHCPTLQYYC